MSTQLETTAVAIPFMADALPLELRNRDQWILWKYEMKANGAATKVPYAVSGGKADTTNPQSWTGFAAALDAYQRGGYSGLGYVFSADDPYCGLDLDSCVVDGKLREPEATYVRTLNSYSEISPSGTGVKVIFRGHIPEGVTRRSFGDGNGLYSEGRYFALTANVYEGYDTIRKVPDAELAACCASWFPETQRQVQWEEAVERLSDEEVLRRLHSAKNSQKFLSLFRDGDISEYASQSEADTALIALMAFYTNACPQQLDRLFRQSALMRDKWDERRRDGTYGGVTIDWVLSHPGEYYGDGANSIGYRGGTRGIENIEAFEMTSAAGEWEAPTSLTTNNLPPFPTAMLPDWLRDFVEAEATATQTPPDLAAMLSLAAVATAVAKKAQIVVKDGYSEPLNLFTVTALPPANRKSAVFADVTAPLVAWEESETKRLRAEVDEAQTRRRMKEAQAQHAEALLVKAKPGDAAITEEDVFRLRRELAALPPVPVLPRLIADDATPEKVASLLAEQGGRLAVLSPEGDVFEVMAGRYSNGTPNIGVYLKGHAGDEIRVDRQGRPSEFVKNPALTFGLTVQPEVLRGLAEKPGFRGRGLLGRFLYAVPESLVGRRNTDAPAMPATVRETYARKLTRLLSLPCGATAETTPAPHLLTLEPQARVFMGWLARHIERELGEFGELGVMPDWGGKLLGAVARIAGLLHMAEHAETQAPWDIPVASHTVEDAWCIGEYLTHHARAAFSDMC
ncbi:MAG TPA: DUF3987 domain-containing protein, partial [Thermomicrobiales bacterium]